MLWPNMILCFNQFFFCDKPRIFQCSMLGEYFSIFCLDKEFNIKALSKRFKEAVSIMKKRENEENVEKDVDLKGPSSEFLIYVETS